MSQFRQRFLQAVDNALESVTHDETFAAALASLPDDEVGGNDDVAGTEAGMWAISDALDRLLRRVVLHVQPATVLEFGAGRSTRAIAESLAQTGGGALTSIEQDPSWCEEHTGVARAAAGVDYELVQSTPQRRWTRLGLVYMFASARAQLARRGPFDMLVIDAPQYWLGRDGALPLIYAQLRPGALLLVDDAGRPGERACLYRWLRSYPGLRLIHYDRTFGGRGLAVLRLQQRQRLRVSVPGALTATRLALTARRRIPRKARAAAAPE